MLRTISDRIYQLSSGWIVSLSILIMILFLVFVLPDQAENSRKETGSSLSPDTSFFYSAEELYQIADEYGEAGRQAYINARWTFDLIFPLVYVFFLAAGISWFSRSLTSWSDLWKMGNLVPVFGGIFDYLENGAATWVMSIYPARLAALPLLAAFFTVTKWILISLAFLLYFILVGGAGYKWAKQKISSLHQNSD